MNKHEALSDIRTPSLTWKCQRGKFSQQRQNIESNSNLMSALSCHIWHYSPYVRSVLSTAVCQNREIKDLGRKAYVLKFLQVLDTLWNTLARHI